MTRDVWLLFSTRCARLFAYGLLSVVLVLYLVSKGLSDWEVGLLLTLTLLGDTAISLWLTTRADRVGRRRALVIGALLMVLAAVLFIGSDGFWLLLLAATIGVISPHGNEVGPFLAIEQAALAQTISDGSRTAILAWYNLVGSFSTALGALCGGWVAQFMQDAGFSAAIAYQSLLIAYGAIGLLLTTLFVLLSAATEVTKDSLQPANSDGPRLVLGLHRSRRVVFRLAALFGIDSFGGGFVIQSVVAYWFYLRFCVEPGTLGSIFFGANILAGISALVAGWLAKRIGLINTMVFTHLPSNVLLILVPFMPDLSWAVTLLLLRFSISQMDVPARQSYTLAVVSPDERSAASGVTGVARSIGAALSPSLAAQLLTNPAFMGAPFILAGSIKIMYDLLLYRAFLSHRPPEERR